MRILLAGAQSQGHFRDLCHVGQFTDKPLNILMSYYYMKRMKPDTLHALLEKLVEIKAWCMLDSGAHTFFSAHGQLNADLFKHKAGTTQKMQDPEVYLAEYLAWLKEYGRYFNAPAELDIGSVPGVGQKRVYEWREQMIEAGVAPIAVYHKHIEKNTIRTRGLFGGKVAWDEKGAQENLGLREQARLHAWEEWCQDERLEYLAISGGWPREQYLPMLRISDKYKKRVHGFAMTNKMVYKDTTFYSVDSTSWLMGQQYGVTYYVQGTALKTADKDHKHVRQGPYFKEVCEKFEIDHKLLMEDDPYAINRFNAAVWCEYQKVIDWQHRNDATVLEFDEAPTFTIAEPPKERDVDPEAKIGRWCDKCFISAHCPYFAENSTCTVPFAAKGEGPTGIATMKEMLAVLLQQAFERLQFALTTERVRGGLLDPEVSKEVKSFVSLCNQIKGIENPTESLEIRASGGPGALSRLFGGYGKGGQGNPAATALYDDRYNQESYQEAEVVDAVAVEVDER